MVVLGKITKINNKGVTCEVSMPYFQKLKSQPVIATAVFAMQPGIIGGYKTGDMVLVTFGNNEINSPIIIGKLYTNNKNNEITTFAGSVKCETLDATKADLPTNNGVDEGTQSSTIMQNGNAGEVVVSTNSSTPNGQFDQIELNEKANEEINHTGIDRKSATLDAENITNILTANGAEYSSIIPLDRIPAVIKASETKPTDSTDAIRIIYGTTKVGARVSGKADARTEVKATYFINGKPKQGRIINVTTSIRSDTNTSTTTADATSFKVYCEYTTNADHMYIVNKSFDYGATVDYQMIVLESADAKAVEKSAVTNTYEISEVRDSETDEIIEPEKIDIYTGGFVGGVKFRKNFQHD